MTEQYVQVPVSLIDRAIRALLVGYGDVIHPELLTELRALLSQPTPSAQPIACPHWEPGRITMRDGCTACAATAAPPSIANTVPMDVAAQTAVVRAVDAEYMGEGGSTRHWVQALNRAGYVIVPDSSTIRDVNPPSIADMAPGKRACADPNVNRWYCQRRTDGTCPLPKCIDSSTIRDVQPPKETP